LTYNSNLI